MDVKTSENGKPPGLIRGLGFWAAAAIVIGSMIGQSVFLVASDMSREVGSMTKVLVVWIEGGVVVLFGAFCYAELGAAMPEAGGEYVYLTRGIGPLWGSPLRPRTGSPRVIPCRAAIEIDYLAMFHHSIPLLLDRVAARTSIDNMYCVLLHYTHA
jgi:amino acid transporter